MKAFTQWFWDDACRDKFLHAYGKVLFRLGAPVAIATLLYVNYLVLTGQAA
jgi:hypothetical protein